MYRCKDERVCKDRIIRYIKMDEMDEIMNIFFGRGVYLLITIFIFIFIFICVCICVYICIFDITF